MYCGIEGSLGFNEPRLIDRSIFGHPVGESVLVTVCGGQVRISHAGQEVAVHAEAAGRRQRIFDPTHFHGVAGAARQADGVVAAMTAPPQPALLRPLAEYEQAAGGGWS